MTYLKMKKFKIKKKYFYATYFKVDIISVNKFKFKNEVLQYNFLIVTLYSKKTIK